MRAVVPLVLQGLQVSVLTPRALLNLCKARSMQCGRRRTIRADGHFMVCEMMCAAVPVVFSAFNLPCLAMH